MPSQTHHLPIKGYNLQNVERFYLLKRKVKAKRSFFLSLTLSYCNLSCSKLYVSVYDLKQLQRFYEKLLRWKKNQRLYTFCSLFTCKLCQRILFSWFQLLLVLINYMNLSPKSSLKFLEKSDSDYYHSLN